MFSSTHPYPFDRSDPKSVSAHCTILHAARARALQHPLQLHHKFSVTALTCDLPPTSAGISDPRPRRPRPWFAQGTAPLGTPLTCKLSHRLRDGVEDCWSQVWMAWVLPPDNRHGHGVGSRKEAGDDGEEAPASVVMKIVQPSLLPIPDRTIRHELYYRSPEGVVEDEVQSYKRFSSIQGDVVPYYFGMQKLEMPSGEEAWVLFLEYIGGPTLLQIAGDMQTQRALTGANLGVERVPFTVLCQIYISALSRIFDIARQDVLLWDIHVSNMVLPHLDATSIVFIDFAEVEFGSGYPEFFWNAVERAFGRHFSANVCRILKEHAARAISAKSISLE